MTPQQLRASLLQQALSGRLVPQRPEDGTADTLYKEIQQEKARLIAEKKIKKEKPLPPITEEEKPFDIPDTWKWVRLPEIAISELGKTLNKTKDEGTEQPYLCSINVTWAGIKLNTVKTTKLTEREMKKYLLKRGDMLVCEGGDIGRTAIWEEDSPMYYQNALHRIRFFMNMSPYFFRAMMEYYKVTGGLDKVSKGVTIKHLVQASLNMLAFPLPPLAEQERIVAKLEELLPLVDQYGDAAARLADYETRFPDDLRKSLLQEAITGRLVPQRAEDGTADTLYEEIQKEKTRLIAEKKIKKEKTLPPITEEEKPFDIPDTWKWIHLGDCGSWASGATPSRTNEDFYNGGTIPWLKTGDLNDGVITQLPEYITELALEKTSVRLNPIGSVLMAMYGATIGRLGILSIAATTNQACCACIPYTGINNKYLFYFLLAWRPRFIKQGAGGAQPNISKEKIVNTPFPLPPLAEQKRIVAKLEELLPLAERIRSAR